MGFVEPTKNRKYSSPLIMSIDHQMLLSKLRYILAYGFELSTCVPAICFLAFWINVNLCGETDLMINVIDAFVFLGVALGGMLGLWVVGGVFIWPWILYLAGKLNGVPFQEGDWVRILKGSRRDLIVRVYIVYTPRHEIRVELGEQEKQEFKDVFKDNEVCLESKFSNTISRNP
jgi:hypothetical protein